MTAERPGDGGRTVDLAHEALIGGWPTLQGWLGERREAEQVRRRLAEKAEEWVRLERKAGFLDAAELAEAERWLASTDAVELGHDETLLELVGASRKELARAVRRLRNALVVALGFLVLALIGLGVSVYLRARAEHEADVNLALSLASASRFEMNAGNDETAALLARQAYRLSQDDDVQGAVGTALQESVGSPFFSTLLSTSPNDASVSFLAFNRDGKIMAVVREDGSLEVWRDEQRISCTFDAQSTDGWSMSVAFKGDGTVLASGGRDGTVHLWNLDADSCRHDRDALIDRGGRVLGVVFSEGGREPLLAAGSCKLPDSISATAPPDKLACNRDAGAIVSIWSLNGLDDPPLIRQIGGDVVCALASSPDGRWLAASGCGSVDPAVWPCPSAVGTITVWDLSTGTNPDGTTVSCLAGHEDQVWSLAFAQCANELTLASGSADRKVGLWDLDEEASTRRVRFLSGQNEPVRSVAFSRDCTVVAAGSEDGSVGIWNLAVSDVETTNPVMMVLGTNFRYVRTVAFGGDDGLSLVSEGNEGQIRQWQLGRTDSNAPGLLWKHTNYVRSLAFPADAGTLLLASAAEDGTVQVWNLSQPNSPPTTLRVGDVSLKVTSVAFSSDGRWLAAGDQTGHFHVWEAPFTSETKPGTYDIGARGDVVVLFMPERDELVVGGPGGRLQVLDLVTGEQPALVEESINGPGILSLAFNHDGTILAAGHSEGTISIWDYTEQGLKLRSKHPNSHGNFGVRTVAFSPVDHDVLASGGDDHLIKVWNIQGFTALEELNNHTDHVRSLAFSPDGKLLISGSRDQTVRIWNTESLTAQPVTISDLDEWIRAIAVSPDGSVLAAASTQGTIRLIVLQSESLEERVCERVGRGPLSEDEWAKYLGDRSVPENACPLSTEISGPMSAEHGMAVLHTSRGVAPHRWCKGAVLAGNATETDRMVELNRPIWAGRRKLVMHGRRIAAIIPASCPTSPGRPGEVAYGRVDIVAAGASTGCISSAVQPKAPARRCLA